MSGNTVHVSLSLRGEATVTVRERKKYENLLPKRAKAINTKALSKRNLAFYIQLRFYRINLK